MKRVRCRGHRAQRHNPQLAPPSTTHLDGAVRAWIPPEMLVARSNKFLAELEYDGSSKRVGQSGWTINLPTGLAAGLSGPQELSAIDLLGVRCEFAPDGTVSVHARTSPEPVGSSAALTCIPCSECEDPESCLLSAKCATPQQFRRINSSR